MLFSTKLPLLFSQVHTIIAHLISYTVEWCLPLGPWPTGYDLYYSAEFMSDGTENMVSIREPHLNMWCTSLGTIALGLSPCALDDAPGLLASFNGQETWAHVPELAPWSSTKHMPLWTLPYANTWRCSGWWICCLLVQRSLALEWLMTGMVVVH